MNIHILSMSTFQVVNICLFLVLFILVFKYLESFWSYKINKPHAWELAIKNKQLSKELIKFESRYKDKVRFYNFWFQIERLKRNKIKGAFAELGVHKGETAKAIHLIDPSRKFYLFDTFEGFSSKDLKFESQKDNRFATDMFADTSVEKVKKYIQGNDNLIFKVGFFPDTANDLDHETFSFVNIDADLYAPTIAALRFFYPRLSAGGVLLVHDYNHNWDGIPKAINEFIKTIPESLIEISDGFGSVMIIKNS
jgi:O-methyltransferase